ncbi:BCCT family transporter [Amphritea sp.]|uniref:BCCT family transporter n=1 Tax=Amphritea sp. TaxID=1872502 RepID=UPI003A8FA0E3
MDSLMTIIVAITVVLSISLTVLILIFYGNKKIEGRYPLGMFSFVAVLFCSGLDIAIITYPLTEFPIFESDSIYDFAHPLAIEIGFWGFIIWSFYFLTAFYFLFIEPKLKLFEIPWVKFINNLVIMATCAYGGYVLLTSIPIYLADVPDWAPLVITATVIVVACYSASDLIFMKWLSIASMWSLFLLTVGLWFHSGGDVAVLGSTLSHYSDYVENIYRFIIPFSDYHEFYLLWWFAWSIMIGQFMSKFATRTTVKMLFVLMVLFPSIPLSIWFAVLYIFHAGSIEISPFWNTAMIVVGIVFVINTFDSLIRLYTDSLNITTKRFGRLNYVVMNIIIMSCLTIAYAYLGLEMEMVGVTVVFLYGVIYFNVIRRRKEVFDDLSCEHVNEIIKPYK